ncbi:MAG: STAS domain-containing protein [Desulfuromonadales bacterium]|nr:STAS domain-containing protein [Desulfuromonadales bacterium]
MSTATLNVEGDIARLSGDLTFATVSALFARMETISAAGGMPPVVDLAAVEQIDSAGLALLLEWQSAFVEQEGGSETSLMRIDNPPQALLKIARLCDAEDYLSNGASGHGHGASG